MLPTMLQRLKQERLDGTCGGGGGNNNDRKKKW